MVSHSRWDMGRVNGRIVCTMNWAAVKTTSVVHLVASEFRNTDVRSFTEPAWQRFVGAANVWVSNIAPFNGGVVFCLHVDWFEPLPIIVDLTLFGPVDRFLTETPDT